ncbi:MAG: hypothetical protein JWP74_3071 [Marmoricola sp.]|nr:hypothetical protein [Marmoricola sp.]
MSEVEALLGLYGAIDRAVVAGEIDAATIAPLLGAYWPDVDGGPATGWYDNQFLPWFQQNAELMQPLVVEATPADLDRAPVLNPSPRSRPIDLHNDVVHDNVLRDLASSDRLRAEAARTSLLHNELPGGNDHVAVASPIEQIQQALLAFPAIPLEGRAPARRFLAVAVVSRALPAIFGSDGARADVTRAALNFIRPDVDPGYAQQLTTHLHVELTNNFTSMGRWAEFVDSAVSQGMMPMSFENQKGAEPCTGSLEMGPSGVPGDNLPCTVLNAGFTAAGDFEEVKRFLRPENWKFPGSIWTKMTRDKKVAKYTWIYSETVSIQSSMKSMTVSTDLSFTFGYPVKTFVTADYRLPPGLPTATSQIQVDTGSLTVQDLGNRRVQVVTSKTVRFAGSFAGAGLAMFMCASGYGSQLEDLVFSIADKSHTKTLAFPISAPTGGTVSAPKTTKTTKAAARKTTAVKTAQVKPATKKAPAKKVAAKAPAKKAPAKKAPAKKPAVPSAGQAISSGGDSYDAIANDTAAFVGSYLKDMSSTVTTSLSSVQAGTYKVENAWADGIKVFTTYMSGVTKVLELGTRATKVYAVRPGDGEPS